MIGLCDITSLTSSNESVNSWYKKYRATLNTAFLSYSSLSKMLCKDSCLWRHIFCTHIDLDISRSIWVQKMHCCYWKTQEIYLKTEAHYFINYCKWSVYCTMHRTQYMGIIHSSATEKLKLALITPSTDKLWLFLTTSLSPTFTACLNLFSLITLQQIHMKNA